MKTIKEETLTAIGDAIREAEGTTELVPVNDMAERISGVYEAGKKAEHGAFWDAFQNKGQRTRYDNGFYRFNSGCFYPKYDIKPTSNTNYMFQYFNEGAQVPLDVAARLEECGVVLDTSLTTNLNRAFYWTSGISRLPEISFESATDVDYCFGTNSKLVTIDKIILPEDGSHPSFITAFASCNALTNLIVQGTIGNNFYIQYSPLSAESITSIINHLSSTTSGLTVFFSKHAVNKAFAGGSTGDEWLSLVASKNNWTISLA